MLKGKRGNSTTIFKNQKKSNWTKCHKTARIQKDCRSYLNTQNSSSVTLKLLNRSTLAIACRELAVIKEPH
jgi:hypothetical protein